MIRPFSLQDMALLNRYRQRGFFLDSVPTLIWGRFIVPGGAVLSTFSSLTGVFTSIVAESDMEPLMGQVVHNQGSPFAHFTFLAPYEKLDSKHLPQLLEGLIARIGARGANCLIADVDVESEAFGALKQAGFSIYTRQRIWRLNRAPLTQSSNAQWRPAEHDDSFAVNLLCGSLVPGLIQQVEPAPWDSLSGQTLFEQGELRAYADIRVGPRGIWMQPFVDEDAKNIEASLAQLLASLAPRRKRAIYICVRSYQDWLEPALRKLGAEEGPRQAVMVRRTTRPVRIMERQTIREAEGRRVEPTTPIRVPLKHVIEKREWIQHD